MYAKRCAIKSCFCAVAMLSILSFAITSCSAPPTPTPPPTVAPTATPIPPTPVPTPKPPPTITLTVTPGPQVTVGQGVAIVLKAEPYEQLNWAWSVTGTSGGQLNAKTGENIVYTAGSKAGVDIVMAEAKTAGGTPVKQTVALTVVAPVVVPPTAPAVTLTPTRPPVPPTATPSLPLVTLTTLVDGQTVPCDNIVRGTFSPDLNDDIWPIVYIGGRYHPQDEAGNPAQKIGTNWYQSVRFGNCNDLQADKGKAFQLIIVTTNASGSAAFREYFRTGVTQGWPGLTELPTGTKQFARIMVVRN